MLGPQRGDNRVSEAVHLGRKGLAGALKVRLDLYVGGVACEQTLFAELDPMRPEEVVYGVIQSILGETDQALGEWEKSIRALMESPGASVLARFGEPWRSPWADVGSAFRKDLLRAAERASAASGVSLRRDAIGAWLGPANPEERAEASRLERTAHLFRSLKPEIKRLPSVLCAPEAKQVRHMFPFMFWEAFQLEEKLVVHDHVILAEAAISFGFPATHPEVLEEIVRLEGEIIGRESAERAQQRSPDEEALYRELLNRSTERSLAHLSVIQKRLAPNHTGPRVTGGARAARRG
ncbi:MAG: hypothetical protein U0974_11925 [Gemmatimonadales bacterium]|nr:hypothetical protein [Gemmatimonadales bacterium]